MAPFLTPELELLPEYRAAKLRWEDIKAVKDEAIAHLRASSPLLAHLVMVKVVVNQRRNFVNIRVKREFLTVLFYIKKQSTHFFFTLADNFQPYVRILPVTEADGILTTLGQLRMDVAQSMEAATADFLAGFKLHHALVLCSMDGYPKEFQTLRESLTQMFGGRPPQMTFSIQLRIATMMYRDFMPILGIFSESQLRSLAAEAAKPDRTALLAIDPFVANIIEREDPPVISTKVSTAVFAVRKFDTCFGFFLSDKFEPYLIITAFGQRGTNLEVLSQVQIEVLKQALDEFKVNFQVSEDLRFHYTTLTERRETDDFAGKDGKGAQATKAHSTAFHLKLKISDEMYKQKFRVLRSLDLPSLARLDPVKYNYSRETLTWEEVFLLIEEDSLENTRLQRTPSHK